MGKRTHSKHEAEALNELLERMLQFEIGPDAASRFLEAIAENDLPVAQELLDALTEIAAKVDRRRRKLPA